MGEPARSLTRLRDRRDAICRLRQRAASRTSGAVSERLPCLEKAAGISHDFWPALRASHATAAYTSVLASQIPQPCPLESNILSPSQRE